MKCNKLVNYFFKFFKLSRAFLITGTFIVFAINSIPEFLNCKSIWAEKTLKSLTLRQKTGQLFIVATASNFNQSNEILASSMQQCPYNLNPEYIDKLIKDYNIGGLIFLYKSDPITQKKFIDKYQNQSTVPLLIAQDSEWGLSMRLDEDPSKVIRYPRNLTIGAIANKNLIYELGKEIGRQCAAIGVHMNLAPVVDINHNPENTVIHDRSFGDNKKIVAECSALYAQGLHDAGIIACAKHFPGHGDTNVDSHLDLPVIKHDINRLESVELYPYKKLISNKKNIPAIMSAHLAVSSLDLSNTPASMSYDIITKKLKNEMNFEGLVITDGLGMKAITKKYNPGKLELKAFLAGNDILLCPLDVPLAVDLIEKAVKLGLVSESDLNQRVLKILKAKEWAFEKHKKCDKSRSDKFLSGVALAKTERNKKITDIESYLVRSEAAKLQKILFDSAITIAKDPLKILENNILQDSCIIQVGELSENYFINSLRSHKYKVYSYSSELTEEEVNLICQNSLNSKSVVIAIGGINKLSKRFGISKNVSLLVDCLKRINKQVIVILFGTPYSIKYFNNADCIIAAYEDIWLTQNSVANILLGQIKATGILPVSLIEI